MVGDIHVNLLSSIGQVLGIAMLCGAGFIWWTGGPVPNTILVPADDGNPVSVRGVSVVHGLVNPLVLSGESDGVPGVDVDGLLLTRNILGGSSSMLELL